MNSQSIQLPPMPTEELIRQTGVVGSPLTLSRGSSVSSPIIVNVEESLCRRLEIFKTYLEHEVQFISSEIQALTDRETTQDLARELAFHELRDSLKIRFNTLQIKLSKVKDLLEVM